MKFNFKNNLILLLIILVCATTKIYAVPEGWGKGWSDYSVLGTASQLSTAPEVLTDSEGNFIIAWLARVDRTYQVQYLIMNPKGEILKSPASLTSDANWTVKSYALFLDDQDELNLFYAAVYNGDYELRYTTNKKDQQFLPKTLKTFVRPFQGLNGVQDSQGNYHLFWSNSKTGNHELYYSKITQDLNFEIDTKPLTLSTGMTTSSNCVIDSQDRIHLIYNDKRANLSWELEYMVLDIAGNPLTYPLVIGRTKQYAENVVPEIIIDQNDQAYIFWCLLNRGGFGRKNYDIYYTVIDTDLKIKYEPILLMSHPEGTYAIAFPPSGYVDQTNRVHLVWADAILKPMTNLYIVIKEEKFLTSAEQLAVSDSAFWLPNLQIDREGNKHLFFMEVINKGQSNVAYMNTISPARVTYWNRLGINEDVPIVSIIYLLGTNIFFAGVGVLLNFIPLSVAVIILLLLEKFRGRQPTIFKAFLLIGVIILGQLSPIGTSVIGVSSLYKFCAGLAALGLFFAWLYLTRKKLKFIELFAYLLGGAIWIYLYIFILLWPVGAQLIR